MNFEEFRTRLEAQLRLVGPFELQEFHYQPYLFGSGILVYQFKGRNHQFVFDGKENTLTWLMSEKHQQYPEATFTEIKAFTGLEITFDFLNTDSHQAT